MSLQDAWVQTLGSLAYANTCGCLAQEADHLPSKTGDDKALIAAQQDYERKQAKRKFAVYGIARMFVRLHECDDEIEHCIMSVRR